MKAPKTAHPHILPSTYYPETTVLPHVKEHESSLVEQIKYQLKYKKARHITNNIYQFRLSKTKETMDYPFILEQLKDLNLEPNKIQYVEQTTRNFTLNLTLSDYKINKLKKELK